MFIDYISLMLINMAGGLVVLAFYILFAANKEKTKSWGPAFAMPGVVALVTGLHMSLTWPVSAPTLQYANVAFGEMSVLFGILFLGAGVALAKGWSLRPMSIYAFLAGAMAIVVGVRLFDLDLTKAPAVTCLGFALTGICGVLAGLFLRIRGWLAVRVIAACVVIAAAAVWVLIALLAYWGHLADFSKAAG